MCRLSQGCLSIFFNFAGVGPWPQSWLRPAVADNFTILRISKVSVCVHQAATFAGAGIHYKIVFEYSATKVFEYLNTYKYYSTLWLIKQHLVLLQ